MKFIKLFWPLLLVGSLSAQTPTPTPTPTPTTVVFPSNVQTTGTGGPLVNGFKVGAGKTVEFQSDSTLVIDSGASFVGPAAGSSGQIQYNNAGALAGATGLTFSSSTLSSTGTISALSLVGLGSVGGTGSLDFSTTTTGGYNHILQNTATTSLANVGLYIENSATGLENEVTSTGYSGTVLTNGPSGQQAAIATLTSIPLSLGVGGSANLIFANPGASSFIGQLGVGQSIDSNVGLVVSTTYAPAGNVGYGALLENGSIATGNDTFNGLGILDSVNSSTFSGQTYNGVNIFTPNLTNGSGGSWTGGYMLNVAAPASGMLGAVNLTSGAVNLGSGIVTGTGAATFSNLLNTPIGNTTANTGKFTTLSASSTVSGVGITSLFASPPSIGGTTPASAIFTNLSGSGQFGYTQTGGAPGLFQGAMTGGGGVLTIQNTSSGFGELYTAAFLNPNQGTGAGNRAMIDFGVNGNANNAAYIGLGYIGNGSSSNYITIGSWSQDDLVKISTSGGNMTVTGTVVSGALTTTVNAIGIGQTDGHELVNTTPAGAAAQQWSPALHFEGQGWKTATTAGSQAVDVKMQLVPVQGGSNPSGLLNLSEAVNGGVYSTFMSLTTAGDLTVANIDGAILGANTPENVFATNLSASGGITFPAFTTAGVLINAISSGAVSSVTNASSVNPTLMSILGSGWSNSLGLVLTAAGTWETASGAFVTSITGTANQITASASTGAVLLSIPSTAVLPGSLEVTTTAKLDGNVGVGAAALTTSIFNLAGTFASGSPTQTGFLNNNTYTAGGNSQSLYSYNSTGTIVTGAFTNLSYLGTYFATPTLNATGGGALGRSYGVEIGNGMTSVNDSGLSIISQTGGTSNNYDLLLGVAANTSTGGSGNFGVDQVDLYQNQFLGLVEAYGDAAFGSASAAPDPSGQIINTTGSNTGIGTITVTATSGAVTGTSTVFTRQFRVGDTIVANSETHTVASITSNTSMTTDAWTNNFGPGAYTLTGATRFAVTQSGEVSIGGSFAGNLPNGIFPLEVAGTYTNPGQFEGIFVTPTIIQTAASNANTAIGVNCAVNVGALNTQNITGLILGGEFAAITANGATGTFSDILGGYFATSIGNSGTVTRARSGVFQITQTAGSTITNSAIVDVLPFTGATNTTSVLIGTSTVPTGTFSINDVDTSLSKFAGQIQAPYFVSTSAASPSASTGVYGGNTSFGALIQGSGSTSDVSLEDNAGGVALEVLTGTKNILINGQLSTNNGIITGVAGSSLGSVSFNNITSGTINLAPPAGALGSVTLTLPDATGTLAISNNASDVQTIAAGTAYTLTGSNAAVTFGTTSPTVTLTAAGVYEITVTVQTNLVGATYASAFNSVTYNLARTNNTPAAISGTTFSNILNMVALTTQTITGPSQSMSVLYTTANTTDVIGVQGLVSATPTAGTVTCSAATINAVWLHQ